MENQEINFNFATREAYLESLDSVLPEKFYETRDLGGGKKAVYLPVAYQEAMADKLFLYWNVTNEEYVQILNEIVCIVRITYTPSYPGAEELYCTGSSAHPIQMDSGAKPNEIGTKKKSNALEYCLPASRSAAVSKALESLGNIFGRNLNRKIGQQTLAPNFKFR